MTAWLRLVRRDSPWLTNAALLLFGALVLVFCQAGVNEYHHYIFGFRADVFGQLVLYLGAIGLIERSPTNRWTLRIVLIIAVLARLLCIFHPTFLSTDVYRYVWDGKVQGAGINPYRYIPADPHLSFLRDKAIYPHINRKSYAHTIYPPLAEAIFFLVTRVSATEWFMKLAMVGFEAVTCAVLLKILRLLRQPLERVVLYAWCPLGIWEVASSGHVDAMAVTFLALAIYFRLRNRPAGVGGWLAAATLIKLYPIAVLPALFRRGEWRMLVALFVPIAVGYACYSSVGAGVIGFLPGFAKEEGIDSGTRFFPLDFVNHHFHANLPASLYIALCGLLMVALSVWALRRAALSLAPVTSVLVLATALILFYAPHYPWYFLWLLPMLTIYPWRPAFYVLLVSDFLFWTHLGVPGKPLNHLDFLLYLGFFLFFAYDLLQRRRTGRSRPSRLDSQATALVAGRRS